MFGCQNYGRFWVPNIVQHLIFRVPKRGHNFDDHPYRCWALRGGMVTPELHKKCNLGMLSSTGALAVGRGFGFVVCCSITTS